MIIEEAHEPSQTQTKMFEIKGNAIAGFGIYANT